MAIVSLLKTIREVEAIVVGDMSGGVLELSGDWDAEGAAALSAYAATALWQAGDCLGLGRLQRFTGQWQNSCCIVTMCGGNAVTTIHSTNANLGAIEKKIDSALASQE